MTLKNPQLKQVRRLAVALMLSGCLNITLIGGFSYWILKERPPTPFYALKPVEKSPEQPLAMEQTSSEVITALKNLPYDQLQGRLSNTQLVENGYSQRDLALAILVGYYHFDLARALPSQPQPMQRRVLLYGSEKLIVYPALSDEQFRTIIDFASTEKWPFTSHGLFLMIKKHSFPLEPSLVDAFILSPQYLAVELLFNRSEVPVDKMELLAVLRDGTWAMLSNFAEKQKISQDLSPSRRQRFLIEYVKQKSKAASYVMLKTDGDFAAKKLDDATILQMLEMLTTRTPSAEKFAIALLSNPRSDAVWNSAASRLYDYLGEPLPERLDPQAILTRFVPKVKWKTEQKPIASPPAKLVAAATPPVSAPKPQPITAPASIKREKLYIVQEGDSFWKIAKKFKTDTPTLKAYNNIQNDFLKPGMSLKIP